MKTAKLVLTGTIHSVCVNIPVCVYRCVCVKA